MTKPRSAIVIGAGHNGLTCAALLAKRGVRVTVVEALETPGGLASTREFSPGFRVSDCAPWLYQLQPQVIKELALDKHGLALAASELATVALSPAGEHLKIRGAGVGGPVSAADKASLGAFHAQMKRFAGLLQKFMNSPPPRLTGDRVGLARYGLDLKRAGREDLREFLRIVGSNIYDVLNEHFDSAALKGAIACDAVLGTHYGPRSPGTVLTYLQRLAGSSGAATGELAQPLGGMGSVADAFAAAARAAGANLRYLSPVARVIVDGGRAVGVELGDGEELYSEAVVSAADPKRTVMDLTGAQHFDTGFVRSIEHLRMRGNAARLHLALTEAPAFRGLDDVAHSNRLLIAPDMDYVERAFNPAKYGEWSEQPMIEIGIPSLADPSLVPAGRHVLSATVQYMPYRLHGGWTSDASRAAADLIIDTIARYAPGLREQIVDGEFQGPADIERRYGASGGHWHHGELAFDQFLFTRPVARASRYALPLDGLFLCGAGAHPGGGVSGAAGRNAARVILKEGGRT